MNENQVVGARKRRSSEEVQRLVVEFETSGLGRNEFCRTRGIALSTLRRHLKNHASGAAGAKAGGPIGCRGVVGTGSEKESCDGLRIGSGFIQRSAD